MDGGGEKSVLVWFNEGREACLGGTPKADNPYSAGEHAHECWERGWRDADGANDREKGYS